MRRVSSWLVALPLALGGSQLAHAEAYRLVYADPLERAHALDATGHATSTASRPPNGTVRGSAPRRAGRGH